MSNLFEQEEEPSKDNTSEAPPAAGAGANTTPLPDSIDAIDDLIKKLQAQRQSLKVASTNAALNFIKQKMTESGISLADIQAFIKGGVAAPKAAAPGAVATAVAKPITRTVPPKYRGPAGERDLWSGRGRKPRWVDEVIAAGKSLDDFLIGKQVAVEAATPIESTETPTATTESTETPTL